MFRGRSEWVRHRERSGRRIRGGRWRRRRCLQDSGTHTKTDMSNRSEEAAMVCEEDVPVDSGRC
jgi:hypothetical protein